MAICFRCGFLGHNQNACPHSHLALNQDSRGSWMLIPKAGRRLHPNSLMPSRNRYPSRSGTPVIHPAIAANMTVLHRSANQGRGIPPIPIASTPPPITLILPSMISENLETPGVPASTGPYLTGNNISNNDINIPTDDNATKKRTLAKDKGKAVAVQALKIPKRPAQTTS
ncbi:hypothetical protein LINGRAHAP2_LOCUS32181 [Linum grandiflorum]